MRKTKRIAIPIGSLQVAERWRDGVRTYIAWWSYAPSRVGYGSVRAEAVRNIPRRSVRT